MEGTRCSWRRITDDTRDDDERVPERFREVQWTRLPGGIIPAAFVERVRRLRAGDLSQERGSRSGLEASKMPLLLGESGKVPKGAACRHFSDRRASSNTAADDQLERAFAIAVSACDIREIDIVHSRGQLE